jgi:phosphatidylglycerol:prolipoprotein diacylglycerol transferase
MFPPPRIGSLQLSWYTITSAIAAAACLVLFARRYYPAIVAGRADRRRIFIAICLYVVALTLVGFAGARLLWVVQEWLVPPRGYHHHLLQEAIGGGGLVWYGGLLLDLVVLLALLPLLLRRLPGVPLLHALDATAAACCLAYSIGRIGCFLTGDGCYGNWTDLPWGMYFPYGPEPTLLPVHPTPLYESGVHAVLLIGLLRLERTKRFPGQTLATFLAVSATARFFVEFIRRNQRLALGLTLAQWISLALVAAAAMLYAVLRSESVSPSSSSITK